MSQEILKDKKVVITAGPTREAIDPVRFISNHSSGKMGYAIAEELLQRGAEVTLVSGPVSMKLVHPRLKLISVESAGDMYLACGLYVEKADIVVFSAAVADYRPRKVAGHKIKKDDAPLTIELIRNVDIAAEFGKHKRPEQISVGFALETRDELKHAVGKLQQKNFDMIVLNSLNDPMAAFGYDTNKVTVITSSLKPHHYPLKPKYEVARDIVKHIAELALNRQSFQDYIRLA